MGDFCPKKRRFRPRNLRFFPPQCCFLCFKNPFLPPKIYFNPETVAFTPKVGFLFFSKCPFLSGNRRFQPQIRLFVSADRISCTLKGLFPPQTQIFVLPKASNWSFWPQNGIFFFFGLQRRCWTKIVVLAPKKRFFFSTEDFSVQEVKFIAKNRILAPNPHFFTPKLPSLPLKALFCSIIHISVIKFSISAPNPHFEPKIAIFNLLCSKPPKRRDFSQKCWFFLNQIWPF